MNGTREAEALLELAHALGELEIGDFERAIAGNGELGTEPSLHHFHRGWGDFTQPLSGRFSLTFELDQAFRRKEMIGVTVGVSQVTHPAFECARTSGQWK